MLLRGANLTVDQKAQVQQIMTNHRATFRDLFSQLRAAQDQMANKLFASGKLQEADLTPEVQKISQLRNQLAEEGLRVVLEIRGILTPER
jgi:Spy/CpxP family protein refolding chaperone